MKKKTILKRLLKLIIVIVILVLVVFLGYQLFINPYRGTAENFIASLPVESELTEKQVLEDIDYTIGKLRERHPAWLEDDNKNVAAVEDAYKTERQQVIDDGVDTYTVIDEWRIIGRIMHQLYDGHSRISYMDDDAYYIEDFTQLKELGLPAEINGIPTEKIVDDYLEIFQYEREEYARACVDYFIENESCLEWVGVDTSDGVRFTYDTEEGKKDYHYSFVPYEQVKGAEEDDDDEWVSYKIDESSNTAVFTLEECNYNDYYESTLEGFFNQVNEKEIGNIIVDLRGNGGGNSYVADAFLQYLDIDGYDGWSSDVRYGDFLIHNEPYHVDIQKKENAFSGNIYVLTDVYTYSAAMDFTMLISDNHLGTVIGEASGNLPDAYGDILRFSLPNSKLGLTISYKNWHRIDQSKKGEPIEPDYICDPKEALSKAKQLISD
ncbi:S41 family peptidase [Butyrivibrio fibrisolvens]|uniref:S41 family peptidase n=1 Tax=Pseudobutyrivibrio ruminis TaxID=46206 RepID=UPI00042911CB|nr:S41 family peptidase [Pseudobutyrivibrio ruminis]MDC7280077.1 S41 family peptidase [Butyrivibrio fibrisolvens]